MRTVTSTITIERDGIEWTADVEAETVRNGAYIALEDIRASIKGEEVILDDNEESRAIDALINVLPVWGEDDGSEEEHAAYLRSDS